MNIKKLIFDIEYLDRQLYLKVWKINVGKTPLYLLDTDIEIVYTITTDKELKGFPNIIIFENGLFTIFIEP